MITFSSSETFCLLIDLSTSTSTEDPQHLLLRICDNRKLKLDIIGAIAERTIFTIRRISVLLSVIPFMIDNFLQFIY